MDLIQSLKIGATGLSANRTKMNVIAENIANAETTRTQKGGPYKRKMVVYESKPMTDFDATLEEKKRGAEGVRVSKVLESQEDARLVYNPSHPDADPATGYVAMPNVNPLTEVADMVVARRAYDANVTAITNAKSMIIKALEIGR